MHSVKGGSVRVLDGLDDTGPRAVLVDGERLEMVQHGARVDVDHVGGLANGHGREHQVHLAAAGAVRVLVVGKDAVVDLKPAFRPAYAITRRNVEQNAMLCEFIWPQAGCAVVYRPSTSLPCMRLRFFFNSQPDISEEGSAGCFLPLPRSSSATKNVKRLEV